MVGNLSGSVTRNSGLKLRSELDDGVGETGRKLAPEQMNALRIEPDKFECGRKHTRAMRRGLFPPIVPSALLAVL